MIICRACGEPALKECTDVCDVCNRTICTDCYWWVKDDDGKDMKICETCLNKDDNDRAIQEMCQ